MNPFRSSATSSRFWRLLEELPLEAQDLAFVKYDLFKTDPYHPSLGFQSKRGVWTVNVGRSYRAMAYRAENHLLRFWIGSHEEYNKLLKRM